MASVIIAALTLLLLLAVPALADPLVTLDRNGALISIGPYGPNIVRVTLALDRDQARQSRARGSAASLIIAAGPIGRPKV